MDFPQYYQYGYVFTKVAAADRYVSVIIMPDGSAQISTGSKPATALPYDLGSYTSCEATFTYHLNKELALVEQNRQPHVLPQGY